MANKQIYEFPLNATPEPIDVFAIDNEFEPGHVTESTSIENVLSTISRLSDLASPDATDYVTVVPVTEGAAGQSFRYDMQSLSDFLVTLQPAPAIPTRQQVYTASTSGIIPLTVGKPGGFSGTVAGVLDPSQTFAQFQTIAAPDQGLHAYASDIDRSVFWDGSSYQQVAWLSDISAITTDGAIGETYFSDNVAETVIALANTPVKVNATYVAGVNNTPNLKVLDGRITNIGADPITFSVAVSLSATLVSTTGQINFYVYLDSTTPVPGMIMQVDVDGVSPSYAGTPMSGTVTLLPAAWLEVFAGNFSSPASTDNIIVKSLNFKIITVGAVSNVLPTDLESAYTEGDGTMIMTTGKPLEFQSNDNAIIPSFNLRQNLIPIISQVIGRRSAFSLNSSSAVREYSRIATVVSNPSPGAEASDHDYYGRTVVSLGTSSLVKYGRYLGESVDFDHSVQGLGSFNFLTQLTLGTQNRRVSSNLGTVIVPTTTYPNSSITSVWQTVDGSTTIAPNSLPVGSTIEIKCFGKIEAFIDDVSIGNEAYFKINFGGIINVQSSNVYPLTIPLAGSETDFEWTFRIIRTDTIRLAVVGNGIFVSGSGNGTITRISFPSQIWTSAYTSSGTYSIGVSLDKSTVNMSGTGFLNYICRGLTINQF